MRELIRPTLFLVARLGLFLSVVVWCVGQWWGASALVKLPRAKIQILVNESGWRLLSATMSVLQPEVRLFKTPVDDPSGFVAMSFGNVSSVEAQLQWMASNKLQVPGIVIFQNPITRFISVRHWLVVTIFALFYGVLKRVYRKRKGDG